MCSQAYILIYIGRKEGPLKLNFESLALILGQSAYRISLGIHLGIKHAEVSDCYMGEKGSISTKGAFG
ncbi:MAG: hypothetical protein A2Y76_04830 [Planctomycetes bacterium RBG_13_60_9]|nr:MAG: hypothetical protein A2Y76_04830 [Planctomycetes bacterium RBG_13_60_9]